MTCDDPDNRDLTLSVEGEVMTFAKVFPSRLRMSGLLDQANVKTVAITPSDDFDLKILDASFEDKSDLTCTIEKKKENKETSYILTITSPNKTAGRFKNTLIVKTNHPKIPKIEVPISGYVSEPPKPKDGKS